MPDFLFYDPDEAVDWVEKAQNKRYEIRDCEIIINEESPTWTEQQAADFDVIYQRKISEYNEICQNLPEDHEWYQAP
ncbi:MAG: hypothetical protein VW235_01405 [Rhodospirillaceae bacterium]|jgi:hypothetical protein